MANLAIITARGGSKRIPRKNIKPFLGIPIINYVIQAALEASIFDEVMVSTDDDEIAQIAVSQGARVPFMRSKKNSDDFATTQDVIAEVLSFYQPLHSFKTACCLYPTAVFVTPQKLKEAHQLLNTGTCSCVFPVQKYHSPIQRAYKIEQDRLLRVTPEYANARTQDLFSTYFDAGQFYFFNVQQFMEKNNFCQDNVKGIVVNDWEAQDIDTPEDWTLAELKYQYLAQK